MDMYKKKPLKFSGLGRDVRKDELNAARRSSRLQRFSLLRSLDDEEEEEEEISKENVPSSSRIPMLGNQKLQAPSRAEMLKKWKNERMLKKKFEEQTKKPVFKVGVASKLQSNQASFNKFNRFGDLSKIQSKLPKNPSSSKIALGVKSKDVDLKFVTSRSQASVIKPQVNKSKDIFKPPIARSQVINALPQASKFKTDNVASRNLKPQITARPIQEIKSKDSNNYNQKPSKIVTTITTADTKGNKKVPYSGLPKPTTSMLPQRRQLNVPNGLNKPAIKSSISGPAKQIGGVLRKPDEKLKFGVAQPKKVEKPKFGMMAPKKEAGKPKSEMVPPKNVGKIGLGKVQPKKEVQKTELGNKQSIKEADNSFASEKHNPVFPCHLSLIEPVEEGLVGRRKSFAPEGFVFRPPIELETSLYLDNGPSAIFARLKNELGENIRTSTPQRKEWNECEEQSNISFIKKTPNTVETSTKSSNSANSVLSSGIKFAEPLLLNSSLEIELPVKSFSQNKESEPDQIQASNVASALDLPQKDQIKAKSHPCLIEVDQATNASAISSTMLNILEEDEMGSLSDSVFLPRSDSNGTKSKRFTRSCRQVKEPSLLKISESPEIQKTPKRVGTPKTRSTLGEFTPRRSVRLARLSQLNSEECLFDVKEPLYSSPGKDSSRLTYDFDKLHLESGETSEETLYPKSTRSSTVRGGKISLLYTPTRTRSSSRLKSYGGDLMAFSPNNKI